MRRMVLVGNHAIVGPVSADDDDLRARLAALEAEVSQKSAADRQRKAEAVARVQARRAAAAGESAALRRRQAELVTDKRAAEDSEDQEVEAPRARKRRESSDLERAMSLARKAGDVKDELSRPVKKGEKSWLVSGGLSLLFGPLGWLYAGSFRETIPAAALYLLVASVLSKILPMFLLMPAMLVLLPLSAIGGLVYAIGYNRAGKRIRLFGDDKPAGASRRLGKLGDRRGLPPADDE